MGFFDVFTGDNKNKKKKKKEKNPASGGEKTIKRILISAGIVMGLILIIIFVLIAIIDSFNPFNWF